MSQRLLYSLIMIATLCLGSVVRAQESRSCLPSFTALQTLDTVDPLNPRKIVRPLTAERDGVTYVTKVQLRLLPSATDARQMEMSVLFDPDFGGVSLPYNLYAVMVLLDGEISAYWDFTHSCAGPGISFFPGREIRLAPVKLIGGKPQKLQIMVWGRL